MILDKELLFADKQAVTASAAAVNIIDLGPLTGGAGVNLIRDIGAGEPLWIFLSVGAQAVAPVGASISITLDTSDTEAMGSPIALGPILAMPANTGAGGLFVARLPPGPYHRYLRASFAVTGGPITQGAFTLGITKDVQLWRAYASGFSTGVNAAQGP
jgi:Bbp16